MKTFQQLAAENRVLRDTVTKLRAEKARLESAGRALIREKAALLEELGRHKEGVKRLPLTERRRLERKSRK